MKPKRKIDYCVDPVYIRKAVKDGLLEFYIKRGNIYCQMTPPNGEVFIVGKVKEEIK